MQDAERRPTLPPEKWTPSSLPRIISESEGLHLLKEGISIDDPTGKEMKLNYDVFRHWVRDGKKLSDIRSRLKNLNRAVMAIRQPNEIRLTDQGERIYLSVQQRQKNGKTYGAKSYYMAVSIKDNSADISTYYHYDGKDEIRQKQTGTCIYSKEASERGRSRRTDE